MDELEEYFEQKEKEIEDICHRCGACCGAYDDDACSHLQQDDDGLFYCDDYENRLGFQKTVNGTDFKCVYIQEIVNESWVGDHLCAYKKL